MMMAMMVDMSETGWIGQLPTNAVAVGPALAAHLFHFYFRFLASAKALVLELWMILFPDSKFPVMLILPFWYLGTYLGTHGNGNGTRMFVPVN
jgi:hypothetical protein